MRSFDLCVRLLGLAAAWILVSEGRLEYWYYGLITVAAGVATSVVVMPLRAVRPPGPRQLFGALTLAGWMAWNSVLGAVDVARRALGPSRLVEPGELEEPLRLRRDHGGLLAAALANLLPGSLVHRIDATSVRIHSLSPDVDAGALWGKLQVKLAGVLTRERP